MSHIGIHFALDKFLIILVATCASVIPFTSKADSQLSFFAKYSATLDVDDNSSKESEEFESLGRKKRIFLSPEVGVERKYILYNSRKWDVVGSSSIALQYGLLTYPDGFSFSTDTATVNFTDPTQVQSAKVSVDLRMRILNKSFHKFRPFAGVGVISSNENITYKLGSWNMKEHKFLLQNEIFVGLQAPLENFWTNANLSCEFGLSIKSPKIGCGMHIMAQ